MFRITTLNKAYAQMDAEELSKQLSPLLPNGIDLLCCQSITHAHSSHSKEQNDETDLLAKYLHLTCSCFAADRQEKTAQAPKNMPLRGQAIFTGPGVWILNSGSFIIGAGDCEEVVLFALVRKNGSSVLVFNFHLADSAAKQELQLTHLFQQSLLKETYGAVVLCTDREGLLTPKKWLSLTAPSSYTPFQLSSKGDALLSLLAARTGSVATIPTESEKNSHQSVLPGLSLIVDIKRTIKNKCSRPAFPLSFREQWLGYRDNRVFA